MFVPIAPVSKTSASFHRVWNAANLVRTESRPICHLVCLGTPVQHCSASRGIHHHTDADICTEGPMRCIVRALDGVCRFRSVPTATEGTAADRVEPCCQDALKARPRRVSTLSSSPLLRLVFAAPSPDGRTASKASRLINQACGAPVDPPHCSDAPTAGRLTQDLGRPPAPGPSAILFP